MLLIQSLHTKQSPHIMKNIAKIGDIQAYTQQGSQGKIAVLVKTFKFDTIRQESYWVTKEVREFRTQVQADAYVARVTR